MGNVYADADGNIFLDGEFDLLRLSPNGVATGNIIGRAVMIHSASDQGWGSATGNAGSRLALGVIGISRKAMPPVPPPTQLSSSSTGATESSTGAPAPVPVATATSYVRFSLDFDYSNLPGGSVDAFCSALLSDVASAMGWALPILSCDSVKSGSVVVTVKITVSGSDQDAADSAAQASADALVGAVNNQNSALYANSRTITNKSSPGSAEQVNTGGDGSKTIFGIPQKLGVGIGLGLGGIIVIIVLWYCFCYKKKKKTIQQRMKGSAESIDAELGQYATSNRVKSPSGKGFQRV
jgi:hypothetical protein